MKKIDNIVIKNIKALTDTADISDNEFSCSSCPETVARQLWVPSVHSPPGHLDSNTGILQLELFKSDCQKYIFSKSLQGRK